MSLFGRFARFVRDLIPGRGDDTPTTGAGGGESAPVDPGWSWDREPDRDSTGTGMPSGWQIVGIYNEGQGVEKVDHDDVSDSDIIKADGIIVLHTAKNGVKSHRFIPGATGVRGVASLIVHQVQVGSPPGTGKRDK